MHEGLSVVDHFPSQTSNTKFQSAMKMSPSEAQKVLDAGGLTPRQTAALRTYVAKAGKSVAPRVAPVESNSVASVNAMIDAIERKFQAIEQRLDEPQVTKAYRDAFASAGGPTAWRAPDPVFSGASSSHRYVHARGSVPPTTVTIPAGESRAFFTFPHNRTNPLRVTSHADTATNALNFAADSALRDRTVTWAVSGDWSRHTPTDFHADSTSHKTADYSALPSTSNQPPMVQVQACELEVKVVVPYSGQAVVRALSEGSNPTLLGRGQAKVMFDVTQDHALGLDSALRGHNYIVNHEASVTPLALATQYCADPILMTGASDEASMTAITTAGASNTWHYAGVLDAIDAAAAGYTSTANNMFPRDSIALASHNGFVVVSNTSATDSITVMASMRATFACILPELSASKAVSDLSNAIRMTAKLLRFNPDLGNHGASPAILTKPGQVDVYKQRWLIEAGVKPEAAKQAIQSHQRDSGLPRQTTSGSYDGSESVWDHITAIAKDVGSFALKGLRFITGAAARNPVGVARNAMIAYRGIKMIADRK